MKMYAGPYPSTMTDDEVKVAFRKQWGWDPDEIIHTGGGIVAGPVTNRQWQQVKEARTNGRRRDPGPGLQLDLLDGLDGK